MANQADNDERGAIADELLAVRCQLGEAAAIDALVERWHAPLWRYVRGLIDDDDAAADALQDAWLRILRALPKLRDPSSLKGFLFSIARRALMDRLRAAYRRAEVAAVDEDVAGDYDDALEPEHDVDLLHAELGELPMPEREALVLFYLRELRLREVADLLEIPLGTVKSRVFRGRRLLRERLLERRSETDG